MTVIAHCVVCDAAGDLPCIYVDGGDDPGGPMALPHVERWAAEVERLNQELKQVRETLSIVGSQRDQLRLALRGASEDIACLRADIRHLQGGQSAASPRKDDTK